MPSERAYQHDRRLVKALIAVCAIMVVIFCVADAPLTANPSDSSESPSARAQC